MLGRALDGARIYLEFGAGGSTIEAVARPHLRSHSVEADKDWIATLESRGDIRSALAEKRLRFTHGDIGPVGAWSFPLKRGGDHPWENYCLAVWGKLPEPPDLVFIDGRFRLACCIVSFLACPEGTGILLHDFGRDPKYRRNYEYAAELGEIVEQCDSLVMLKRKPQFDYLKAISLLNRARKDVW